MSKAKDAIWLWEEIETWEQPFWRLLSDIIDERVIALFRENRPEYIVGDNLNWLDELVHHATGKYCDIKDLLTDRVQKNYGGLKAYHGTRTGSVEDFYKNGLKPLNPVEFEERARSIFLTPAFPEITPEVIEAAIAGVGRETREGRIYFGVNKKDLLEWCAHYLLYGSEYVIAIAAHLKGVRDYRQILKREGKPTLLVCNVPLSLISHRTLTEFVGEAIATMFERVLDAQYFFPQNGSGGGFSIGEKLAPKYIAEHIHPDVLRDPFLGFQPVHFREAG